MPQMTEPIFSSESDVLESERIGRSKKAMPFSIRTSRVCVFSANTVPYMDFENNLG